MVIRSAALRSALAGMTAAHDQVAVAAQNLAKPLFASPAEFSSASSQGGASPSSESPATESMSNEIGSSLIELNESLTQARVSSVTAGAAQAMLEELLEIGRQ
jgi:hypothetical protein